MRQRRSRLRHAALAGPAAPKALPDIARQRAATLTARSHEGLEAGLSKPGGVEHHVELLARDPSLCRQRSKKSHPSSTSLLTKMAPYMGEEGLTPCIQVFPPPLRDQKRWARLIQEHSGSPPGLRWSRRGRAKPSHPQLGHRATSATHLVTAHYARDVPSVLMPRSTLSLQGQLAISQHKLAMLTLSTSASSAPCMPAPCKARPPPHAPWLLRSAPSNRSGAKSGRCWSPAPP